jgi:homopolymeric O-antigen transport system permease protein
MGGLTTDQIPPSRAGRVERTGVKREVERHWYALRALVRRDLAARYGQTVLGLGWTVVQPLMLLVLYTFVFSVIMKLKFRAGAGTGDFALYLTCGMFPFLALSEGIQRATNSLTENKSLLDKVRFPAEVLPAVAVVGAGLTETIGLLLLLLFTPFFDVQLSLWLAFLPLLIVMRLAFTMGLAWLASVLNVFFTDLGQMIGLLLTSWMFLTPIFYPVAMVPEGFMWLVEINPLHQFVSAYRAVVLEARSPLPMLPALLAWTVASCVLGWWFFRRTVENAKDFL